MKLAQKFAIAAAASLSTACLASFGEFDRNLVWGYMSDSMEEYTTPSFEGSKAIKRLDMEDNTTLFTFDTAKNELCINTYKRNHVKGKPQSVKCQSSSRYYEPHLEMIIYETCSNALKDAVNARQVLDFCAQNRYGKTIVKPELTYEGTKAIKRLDSGSGTVFMTFDVATREICTSLQSPADRADAPTDSLCVPTSNYPGPELESVIAEICRVAQKDPVGAKQVLDFCAQDPVGQKVIKPKP